MTSARSGLRSRRVLCVGNELCHDDGVAIRVAEILTRLPGLGAEIIILSELSLDTIEWMLDAERLVVVDAMVTGRAPGHVMVDRHPRRTREATTSVGHAVTLGAILELADHLRAGHAPLRTTLIGIEAADMSPFGITLSPKVRAAIPRVLCAVMAELWNLPSAQLRPKRFPRRVRVGA
jgi:hydrogenase maturation protease